MSWSALASGSAGSGDGSAVSLTLNTVGANVLVLIVAQYGGTPATGDISESGASANTWIKKGPQANGGDAGLQCTVYYVISPNTNTSHGITVTNGSYPAITVFALSQGSAPTFVTEVGSGAGTTSNQPGSIGNANDLVIDALAHLNAATSVVIDGSFSTPLTTGYVNNFNMGVSGAWKQVSGAVNPTWSWSGTVNPAGKAVSFTGTASASTWGPWVLADRWNRIVQGT